jgi:hypothetical protein
MNLLEGSHRMQVAGRLGSLAGVSLFGLGIALGLLLKYTDLGAGRMAGEPVMLASTVMAAYILFPGSLLWLAGWILEGFARPKSEPSTPNEQRELVER